MVRMAYSSSGAVSLSLLLLLPFLCYPSAAQEYEYSSYDDIYSYGDPNIPYDDNPVPLSPGMTPSNSDGAGSADARQGAPLSPRASSQAVSLPLCCPEGQVYNYQSCVLTQDGSSGRPRLDALPSAHFYYKDKIGGGGFPRCSRGAPMAEFYYTEVFFRNSSILLPRFIQITPVPEQDYCITKVADDAISCDQFLTKVFVCVDSNSGYGWGVWVLVGVAHLLLFLTLLAYTVTTEIRALQGQYMICFVASLLLYNIWLYPLSAMVLPIDSVTCIALRAMKCFFFCSVFLWYNVICFDVWRTLSQGKDINSRRRLLCYALYTWVFSAGLTIMLVLFTLFYGSNESQPFCEMEIPVHFVLQLAQGLSIAIDLVFVCLSVFHLCSYNTLGAGGLPRSEASQCVSQCFKLFIIMVAHSAMSYFTYSVVQPWMFMLLESAAIFGVFAYRSCVLKEVGRACTSCCVCARVLASVSSSSSSSSSSNSNGSAGIDMSPMTSLTSDHHNSSSDQAGPLPHKVKYSSAV